MDRVRKDVRVWMLSRRLADSKSGRNSWLGEKLLGAADKGGPTHWKAGAGVGDSASASDEQKGGPEDNLKKRPRLKKPRMGTRKSKHPRESNHGRAGFH